MLQKIVNEATQKMKDVIIHFESVLNKISTGIASVSMLDGITADYYGNQTPINQMATISCSDARQIVVKPYDKNTTEAITNAINSKNMGLNANDSGDLIRINVPALTEETRKREAKKVWQGAENAKIVVRQIRQDSNNKIKSSQESDDDKKGFTEDIQELVKEYNNKIDNMAKEKEKNILKM